jgi:hypothetical protein
MHDPQKVAVSGMNRQDAKDAKKYEEDMVFSFPPPLASLASWRFIPRRLS